MCFGCGGQEPGLDICGGHPVWRFGETRPVCGWHSSANGRTYPVTTVESRHVGPLPHESRTTLRPLDAALPAAVANARVAPMREWTGVAPMREWISDTQAG